jgi:hypothetical protein
MARSRPKTHSPATALAFALVLTLALGLNAAVTSPALGASLAKCTSQIEV